MKIDRIDLIRVKIPLVHHFETSFGRVFDEEHILVKLYSDGMTAYGESPVTPEPYYTYETLDTVWHIQKDFIAPLILNQEIGDAEMLNSRLERIRGHNFAKYGFESAFWTLDAQFNNEPLYKSLGGNRNTISSGVSIGIQDTVKELLELIESFLAEGYKRIKVKIKPGWDSNIIKEIRKEFGDIPLMCDANSAYTLKDIDTLLALDEYNLMMIEQPLHYDDLSDHSILQAKMKTPICLDESIKNFATASAAVKLKSCRIINIKPGRVGGLLETRKIHDLCLEHDIPVWCGGMLEFGIGRAVNLAVCTLDNFTFPGDVSSSGRYFKEDLLTEPIELENGEFTLSEKAGTGFSVDEKRIEKYCIEKLTLK